MTKELLTLEGELRTKVNELEAALAAFLAVLAWMDNNHEKENLQPAAE